MHGQRGLPYPGHPTDRVDRHYPAGPGSVRHRSGDAVQFAVPAGERRRVRRQRVPHCQCRRRRSRHHCQPAAGDLRQRVEHLKLQIGSGSEGADDQPGITQPLPEPFHRAAIGISQRGQRTGSAIQQEHQPRQASGTGRVELQLGIGHRLARYHRAIPETDHRDVDLALADPLPAVVRRLPVARGEVAHVDRRHPGPAHRVQRSLHERPALRELRHIGGMGNEHLACLHHAARCARDSPVSRRLQATPNATRHHRSADTSPRARELAPWSRRAVRG